MREWHFLENFTIIPLEAILQHIFLVVLLMLVAAGFLLALSASAPDQVSGIGLWSSGSVQGTHINLDVYSSVNSIVSAASHGPNGTNSVALPVDKLYGVNVHVYYHNYKLWQ